MSRTEDLRGRRIIAISGPGAAPDGCATARSARAPSQTCSTDVAEKALATRAASLRQGLSLAVSVSIMARNDRLNHNIIIFFSAGTKILEAGQGHKGCADYLASLLS